MIKAVENNIEKIREACKKYKVTSLYLFGSGATGNTHASSDVDLLISYKRDKDGLPEAPFDYFDFLFLMEEITGKKVDLIVEDAVENRFFRNSVEKQKLLLYAG